MLVEPKQAIAFNSQINIEPSTVYVWQTRIMDSVPYSGRLLTLLSEDERQMSLRYKFDTHRWSFIIRRAFRRCILSLYLDAHPSSIILAVNEQGKPYLDKHEDSHLKFNCSYSNEVAVMAVASGREVGIDVEQVVDFDFEPILNYFAPSEKEALSRTEYSGAGRLQNFFLCWTRKEAFVKAYGRGLRFPLNKFEVAVDAAKPARLIAIEGDKSAGMKWFISDLNIMPGYSSALAISGAEPTLLFLDIGGKHFAEFV